MIFVKMVLETLFAFGGCVSVITLAFAESTTRHRHILRDVLTGLICVAGYILITL